jgi:hypothetical protein
MADLTVTAANVGRGHRDGEEVFTFLAGVAITRGQAVYFNTTTGKLALADASAAGTAQFRGIALQTAQVGQSVDVIMRGYVSGFDLSGRSYDDLIYVSDTAGALADAAGTVTAVAGRVIPLPSSRTDVTKALFIDWAVTSDWS